VAGLNPVVVAGKLVASNSGIADITQQPRLTGVRGLPKEVVQFGVERGTFGNRVNRSAQLAHGRCGDARCEQPRHLRPLLHRQKIDRIPNGPLESSLLGHVAILDRLVHVAIGRRLRAPLGPDGNGTGDPSPSPAANQSLFTAGGAIGLAFAALDRDWRVEFEGRGRNNLVSNRTRTFDAAGGSETYLVTTTATNGWSTTVNLWRDYELSDRWTMYAGGGIGAGGYRFTYQKFDPADNYQVSTAPAVSAFALQAGGGTAYAITDRITLDIGYRFFQIANGSSTAVISYPPGPPVGSEVVGSAFRASELFFAFRIDEPFRNWR